MSFTPVSVPSVGDPMTEIWGLLTNDIDLFQRAAALENSLDRIPNGSFENDTDSDGVPDGWVARLYEDGQVGITDDYSGHGKYSFYATSGGGDNSGGCLFETDDFIPAKGLCVYSFRWKMKASLATIPFNARVKFYDGSKSYLGSSTIYDSPTSPTSWATRGGKVKSTSGAKFMKLFFEMCPVGCDRGTTYLDQVEFFVPVKPKNRTVYSTPGTYTFTAPEYVTAVHVTMIGAGGGGAGGNNLAPQKTSLTSSPIQYYNYWDLRWGGGGGGGGAFFDGWVNVSPGESITVVVPSGGAGGGYARLGWGINGTTGPSAWFGTVEAKGGAGGVAPTDNTATGTGGAGGSASVTGASIGVSGTDGTIGGKQVVALALADTFYFPTGGAGGVSGYRAMFASVGGSGGAFTYSGLFGFAWEEPAMPALATAPTAGTGYGAGGGGGSFTNNGGAGTQGIVVVDW